MAVTEQSPINNYTGNGATTVFAFSFLVLAAADLSVKVSGVLKTLGVDYTVSGVGVGAGGTVTFLSAPAASAPVSIYRDSALARATDYQTNGDLLAGTINTDFDRLWLVLQELMGGSKAPSGSIRAPAGEVFSELVAAAARRDKLVAFDPSTGDAVVTSFTATQVASAVAAAYAAGSTADAVSFIQSGAGAVATTVQAKLREAVVSITDFGVVYNDPTKGAVNLAALQAAVDHFSAAFDGYYGTAGTIRIPFGGDIYVSAPWVIDRAARIEWEASPDGNNTLGARLVFPAGSDGIIIDSRVHGGGTDASGCTLVNPSLYGSSPNGTAGNGIKAYTRCHIINPAIDSFGGDGINIDATAAVNGNANNWKIEWGRSQSNGGHGLAVGAANNSDVNAANCIGLDCSSNGKSGIADFSFLGNTYLGCHVASNGKKSQVTYLSGRYYCMSDTLGASTTPGSNEAVWTTISHGRVSYGGNRYACISAAATASTTTPGTNPAIWSLIGAGGVSAPEFPLWVSGSVYHVDGASSTFPAWSNANTYYIGSAYRSTGLNARNLFVGCYSESGQPPSVTAQLTMVIGGLHAADFDATSAGWHILDGYMNATRWREGGVLASNASARVIALADTGSLMSLRDPAESSGNFPIRLKGATGRFFWDWANSTNSLFEFTNSLATVANGFPREVATRMGGAAGIAMRQGYFRGGAMKFVGTGTAAPASGTYVQGDIVYNETPASAGFIGWVCTVAGTPGTWKTFGLIS